MTKKIDKAEVRSITFRVPWDETTEWEGFLLPDARLIAAEDATDDDWKLLDEYSDYFSITGGGGLEEYYIHRDDIHYECFPASALVGGYGYRNPWEGDGFSSTFPEIEIPGYHKDGSSLLLN